MSTKKFLSEEGLQTVVDEIKSNYAGNEDLDDVAYISDYDSQFDSADNAIDTRLSAIGDDLDTLVDSVAYIADSESAEAAGGVVETRVDALTDRLTVLETAFAYQIGDMRIVSMTSLPSDASQHTDTLYVITEDI